ncbi:MAG: toll/interleukin-1 receptor domain-containing protein, partial [Taibaiella sp.]|nr:toll/interleukin-1 receptor domain-containing protein [Taibaiella sp.]
QHLSADLEKSGIDTWIDQTGIEPGEPVWEEVIRKAITQSFGILLIATTNSRNSRYVTGEINLANEIDLPILPIWAAGESWSDSVMLAFSGAQYVDLRNDAYSSGLEKLVRKLYLIIDEKAVRHIATSGTEPTIPKGYWHITQETDDYCSFGLLSGQKPIGILLRFRSYPSLQSLLDDLYLSHLRNRFSQYTYLRDWILAECVNWKSCCFRLLAFPKWYEVVRTKVGMQYPAAWLASIPAPFAETNRLYIIENPYKSIYATFTIAIKTDLFRRLLDDDLLYDFEETLINCCGNYLSYQEFVTSFNSAKGTTINISGVQKTTLDQINCDYEVLIYGWTNIDPSDDEEELGFTNEVFFVS